MSNKDDHTVITDIPRQGLHSLRCKEILIKGKNLSSKKTRNAPQFEGSVNINSMSGSRPLCVNEFKKEGVFLLYNSYIKRVQQINHKQNLAISMYDKHQSLNADVRERLHVDIPCDDVHAIKDVDVDFFNCVNGRPFSHYAPPFKSLRYLFNKQKRFNIKLGFIKDSILNIVENYRKEEETYEIAVKQYVEQSKNVDNFISDDYHNSMKCLIKCDKLVLDVNEKIIELQTLAIEKFTIKSRLIGLNYLYGHHQKYGRFLYYLSPPLWRLKNREFARSVEIEAKGFDFGIYSEEDTFNEIFENMKKECIRGLVKPALYFTHPSDLITTFGGIEKQQLHNFTHVISMTPHIKFLMDRIEQLKHVMARDTAGVVSNIKSFEKLLSFYDDVCAQLKDKFFRLIYGSFYNDVGSFDVLKLKLHLEFCYEKVYLDKPINMDIVSLTRALEIFYMEHNKQLEAIHSQKIKAAVLHNLELERNTFRRAKVAARELQSFCRLERSLQRSCEPKVENQLPVLKYTKLTSTRKMFKRVNSQGNTTIRKSYAPILTEAETEYLTLFTNWTVNEDPARYLQSLTISQMEKASLD